MLSVKLIIILNARDVIPGPIPRIIFTYLILKPNSTNKLCVIRGQYDTLLKTFHMHLQSKKVTPGV